MQLVFDFPVNPRYGFDNFVVCSGNEVAFRFARMLVQERTHNLLYIYGPPGSGKTHLLAALGNCLYADKSQGETGKSPELPYLSFGNVEPLYRGDYLAEQTSRLAERFRNAPALLVDDIHLIPDNVNLRIELWQIFNDFFDSGRKIAITGNAPPRELPTLDDHLISRLLWGLVAAIDVSDDDSRRLIMKKLAEDRQIKLSADVINYLLHQTRRDIPSLAGTLENLNRHALVTGKKISLRLVQEVLERKDEN